MTIQNNSQLLARRLIKTTATIGVDMALMICPAPALGRKKQEPESTGTENPE